MIHECIEANRDKFVRYEKIATVIGWVLLIGSAVIILPTLYQYGRILEKSAVQRNIFLQFIHFSLINIYPAFSGMFFLMLGQFIKYELGPESQPGWFFRNGSVILRTYAAVFIGLIIIKYVGIISNIGRSSLGDILLALVTPNRTIILYISKALFFWGLATVVKLMMDEIRKKRLGAIS